MSLKQHMINIRRGPIAKTLLKFTFRMAALLPVKKKMVMFESFHGKQYSDNPRAIYEYMVQHNPDYELIWSADRRHLKLFSDKQVRYVRRFSLQWIISMARSQYWVSNSRLPLWIPKPKHTTYIQTWHGTPLKRLAADMDAVHMPGTDTERYKRNFLYETSKWDVLISPNAYSTEIFRRAFAFQNKMLETGYPRNDFLFQKDPKSAKIKILQQHHLPTDKKVILYAPTWRDNQFHSVGNYKFDLQLDLDEMYQNFGHDYIIILRMHYLVAENIDLSAYEGFVYDFSKHEDIRELYIIADLLITDYSSVFFDYANLRRPILFFVYDIDEYRDKLRGFYFDFEKKAPGPLVKETAEIVKEIKKIEKDGYQPTARVQAFYDKFCYLEDGQATKRVVEDLFHD